MPVSDSHTPPPQGNIMNEVTNFAQNFFSWSILAVVSIIISGKFLSKMKSFGYSESDVFSLDMHFLKLKAKGDEVVIGLGFFLVNVAIYSIFNAHNIEVFVKSNVGLEIGPFRSMCFIASLSSVTLSFFLSITFKLIEGRPIIHQEKREIMIDRLEEILEAHDEQEARGGQELNDDP